MCRGGVFIIKLMVLGLLSHRSMTGYEMLQYLKMSYAEQWAGIKIGSLYYALNKMESEALIEIKSVENVGKRSKTTYSITQNGDAFFEKHLEERLSQMDLNFPAGLYSAITFLGNLPNERIEKAIDHHIDSLQRELLLWKNAESLKAEAGSKHLSKYMFAMFKNGCGHIELNIEFLKEIKSLLSKEKFEAHLPDVDAVSESD